MTRLDDAIEDAAVRVAEAVAGMRTAADALGDRMRAAATSCLPHARGRVAESARGFRDAGLSVLGVTLPGMADEWAGYPVMQVPDHDVRRGGGRARVTGFGAGEHGKTDRRRPRKDAVSGRDRSGNYLPPESEEEFQRWVIETAHLYRWLVHHARPAPVRQEDDGDGGWRTRFVTPIQGDAGAPDLLLCKVARLPLHVELKRDDTYLKPNQKPWRAAIPPDQYRLWRPRDRPTILAELAA